MSLPLAGTWIKAEAQAVPTDSQTDTLLLVRTALLPTTQKTAFFADANSSDGARGRVSASLSGDELPSDWVAFDNVGESGDIYIKYSGVLAIGETAIVYLYSPNTRNAVYLATNTYGSNNAYKLTDKGVYPILGDSGTTLTDRTLNGEDGSLNTGVTISTDQLDFASNTSNVDIMSGKLLDGASEFTVSFNFNLDDITGEKRFVVFNAFAFDEPFIAYQVGDQVAILMTTSGGTTAILTSASVLSALTDYRIDVSYDGANVYAYLDGVQIITAAITGTLIPTAGSNYRLGYTEDSLLGSLSNIRFKTEADSLGYITYNIAQENQATFWGAWDNGTIVDATYFSYANMNAGFSGYFNFVDDPLERKFWRDALWNGTITGTDTTLKVEGSPNPYVVIVDGVESNPTVAGGEITLFSGLTDIAHDVQIFSHGSYISTLNGLVIAETQLLAVSGVAPAIVNNPIVFTTFPNYLGLNREPKTAAPGGDITPTYDVGEVSSDIRGSVIFNAQIDELWVYTDDAGVWLSIDDAEPVYSAHTQSTSWGTDVRRLVKLSDTLDNAASHKYHLWGDNTETLGIFGILPILNGAVTTHTAVTGLRSVSQYGDSITEGSGATPGTVDCWGYSLDVGFSMSKCGIGGIKAAGVGGLAGEIPAMVAATEVPLIALLAIGRNDVTNPSFEADYTTCVDALINEGIEYIICRGITPNPSAQPDYATILAMNITIENVVNSYGNPKIVFMPTITWDPIQPVGAIHPNVTGYQEMRALGSPAIQNILDIWFDTNPIAAITYYNRFLGGLK